MKTTFSFALLVLTQVLFAQVTLQTTDVISKHAIAVYHHDRIPANSHRVLNLQSGMNQVWDYSSFNLPEVDSVVYEQMKFSQFNDSVYVFGPEDGFAKIVRKNGSNLSVDGDYYHPSSNETMYETAGLYLQLPLHYQQTWSSSYRINRDYRAFVVCEVDGYGSVKTQLKDYKRCLRLKQEFGTVDYRNDTNITNHHYYYCQGIGVPVVHYSISAGLTKLNVLDPNASVLPNGGSNFPMGFDHFNSIPGVKLFPNPTSGESTLQFEKGFSGIVKIYDNQGREVMNQECRDQNEVRLNLGDLENGMYSVQIENEVNLQRIPLIIYH